ncbi:hypothetical protein RCF19_30075 [Rhodococcus qingshengii]
MMVALGLLIVPLIAAIIFAADLKRMSGRINAAVESGLSRVVCDAKPTIAEARKLLATDQFEAWTHCPHCGRYDVHKWREPKEPSHDRERDFYAEMLWTIGTPSLKMPYPSSEWGFTVIRICACSKEWGQK